MKPTKHPLPGPYPADSGGEVLSRLLLESARCVVRDLDAAAATVFLRVPDTPYLRAAAVAVTPLGVGSIEEISLDDEIYPSAQAWHTGRVATAHSVSIMAGHPVLSILAPFPYQVAAMPLFSATRRWGTLAAFWPRIRGEPGQRELDRLAQMAEILTQRLAALADQGIAVIPPRLPRVVAVDVAAPTSTAPATTPATAPFIYHLHKLAILLALASRTQDVVDLVLERASDGFLARAAVMGLIEGERLHIAGAAGCSAEFLRAASGVPLARSTPETEVITSGRQQIYAPADTRTWGRLPEGAGGDVFWIVLPLQAGHRPIGTLSLAFDSAGPDVIAEQATLTALATILAQAVERAQMLDAQRALAEGLQQALLPPMLPQPAGVITTSRYASATRGSDLGGDWYDLVSLPVGGVAMVIGDVEGHNTAAIVVMGQLRTAVRAFVSEGHDPATVLARANQTLLGLDTGLFATCCCARLDTSTGWLQVAVAGHPAPLLRIADDTVRSVTVEGGIPLGVDLHARFETAELQLDPGTLLAFHTNGLDRQTVITALQARQQMETLGDRIINQPTLPRTGHTDDAALLLVRYEGPSAEAQRNVRQLRIQRHDLRGARRARALLREWLTDWGLSALIDEEELLVSEIVTNGLVHGDSDVHVYVRRYPEYVRVEVRDSDPRPARTATAPREEDQAEGGRGLVIVSALASAWGNSPSGRGKTVWFELPVRDEGGVSQRL